MLFMAVDGKQQIGYESSKYLGHETMGTAGDQVIQVEVLFPPAEEYLDIPAELVNKRNILRF
jgi:hypothetical protein